MPPGPDPQKRPKTTDPQRPSPPVPQGQRPPPRRPLPPRPPPRARRHHHRGKASRARIGLIVVFVLFRLLDFITLNDIPPELSRQLVSSVITSAIWTTALLIGIWLRKPWARLILIALLGLASVSIIILIPMIADYPAMMTPLVSTLAVHAGVFGWLILSRDVRRLTSRERE